MEFIVIVFSTVFGFNLWAAFETMEPCNNDIVDIYYPVNKEYLAYDWDCPYTKTVINCNNCTAYFVRRSQYARFTKSYRDYDLKPPFPARTDITKVYKPKSYN